MMIEDNPTTTHPPRPSHAAGPLIRFLVRHERHVAVVRADAVDWLAAAGNYVVLHVGSETHIVRESLLSLEAKLDPARFVRISRGAMVNLDAIRTIASPLPGEPVVTLKDGSQLPVTRGVRELQARLEYG